MDLLHIRLLIVLVFSLRATFLFLFVCVLLLVDVVFIIVWDVATKIAVVLLICRFRIVVLIRLTLWDLSDHVLEAAFLLLGKLDLFSNDVMFIFICLTFLLNS